MRIMQIVKFNNGEERTYFEVFDLKMNVDAKMCSFKCKEVNLDEYDTQTGKYKIYTKEIFINLNNVNSMEKFNMDEV